MKQALLVCDLTFTDGSGPYRATGSNSWELLRSIGKEHARDNDIYIKDCLWISDSNTHIAPRKEEPKGPKISKAEQKRIQRLMEARAKYEDNT